MLFLLYWFYFFYFCYVAFPEQPRTPSPPLLKDQVTTQCVAHTHYHTHDKKLSNLCGVIVTTCLMSSKDTLTYPPMACIYTLFALWFV